MTVGVVIERRALKSAWADEAWLPVAVLPGDPGLEPGAKLRDGEGWAQFYAGSAVIELFRKESASYVYNFERPPPKVYVALRRDDEGRLPWRVLLVTVAPDEAQAAMEGGEDIVEAVPMPEPVERWVAAFCERHPIDEMFVKRKRKRYDTETLARRPKP